VPITAGGGDVGGVVHGDLLAVRDPHRLLGEVGANAHKTLAASGQDQEAQAPGALGIAPAPRGDVADLVDGEIERSVLYPLRVDEAPSCVVKGLVSVGGRQPDVGVEQELT